MKKINENMAIGELVSKLPQTTNYFIKEDIDFCCGGDRPLKEAVKDSNKNLDSIIKDLNEISRVSNSEYNEWEKRDPVELINHIVATHHEFLKENLPLIDKLAFKVLLVHGDNHEELFKVHKLMSDLKGELQRHLVKEEKLLFPAIENNNKELINELIDEHDAAGNLIKNIKEITDHYKLPEDACESYKAFYKKIEELEIDIYHHVHLENNILFKKL